MNRLILLKSSWRSVQNSLFLLAARSRLLQSARVQTAGNVRDIHKNAPFLRAICAAILAAGMVVAVFFPGGVGSIWLLLMAFVSTGFSLSQRLPVQNVCAILLVAVALALGHVAIEARFRSELGDLVFYKTLCVALAAINARIIVRWMLQRNPLRRNVGLHILWLSSISTTVTLWAASRFIAHWFLMPGEGSQAPVPSTGEMVSLVGMPWLIQISTMGWWIKTKPDASESVPTLALLNFACATLLAAMARF